MEKSRRSRVNTVSMPSRSARYIRAASARLRLGRGVAVEERDDPGHGRFIEGGEADEAAVEHSGQGGESTRLVAEQISRFGQDRPAGEQGRPDRLQGGGAFLVGFFADADDGDQGAGVSSGEG